MSPVHPPLLIAGLTKSYASRAVLKDVTLSLQPGEVTALVGPSGAGKTTLMRLIAGMERVDQGSIQSGETLLSAADTHLPTERRQIGLVFQDFALFPHLNVRANIMFGLARLAKPERRRVADDWIDRLALGDRASAFPHQLSGGEQQRVAIARAMAPDPRVLLMDEPFSGLDPELRHTSRSIALEAIRQAGIPALLVTHDPVEALAHADTVAVMQLGRLIQVDAPDHLYMRPASLAVATALGRVQTLHRSALPEHMLAGLPADETLYLRPEALTLDPAGGLTLRVIAAHRRGTLCELTLAAGDLQVTCVAILPALPRAGDSMRVSLNPAYVLRLPRADS